MNQPVSVKPSPLPIGELLVREGVLSPALVAKILQRQEQNAATGRTHKLFGQICVEMQLVKSAQLQKFLAKYHKRILLGELLVCLDLLTPPQLQQTLAIQKKYPKHKFGAILVKLGALTETQLTDALSQQLDIPKILPTPEAGVSNLLGSLDPEFVRQNLFFPVSAGEDQVTVAMEDPQNQALIEYLFQSFSRRVVPVIAPATQLKAVIEEYIEHYHARKKSKPQLTSIGPLEISIDAQREIDKAGRTHGLGFLDTQEFQGITPPRVAEPAKAQTPDQQAVPEQTLIERWPFLLVDKAAEAQGQANQPAGPSIDEILMQKFGMSEDMDMQSTFILSSQPTQVSSPDSVQLANRLLDQLSQQNVDLRSTLKFETQQLDLQSTLVLPGAQQAPATAETENPQSTSADPAAAAATPAEAESEEEETDLEDTLIVGKISLASSRSQFRQEEGMLNYLIKSALLDQATAIYIEPQGLFMRVRYRIDGVLHQKTALPPNLGLPMLARLKQLCALNPENTATPQRNRVQARFNQSEIELSIATYPSISGESLALNFKYKLDASQSVPLNLAGIGLSPLYLWRLKKLLGHPGGLLVVTGPARAGKTSTLYAACNYLNLLTQLIVTAESPVEQTVPGLIQGNWTPDAGGSFAEMIQAMGFMAPEVMMVSEFESPDTVKASVELALSGAKVMSSYQSFDTMGALQRLLTQGLESYLIASGQTAILSQRLVRKLCQECKQPETPSREALNMLGLRAVEPETFTLWRPGGCGACSQGYSGQLAIHELLVINEAMSEAILARRPAAAIRELARSKARLISMAEDGYFKATEGLTSLAELQRVAFINEYDADSPLEAEQLVSICKAEDKEFI